jgi:single-strand DNA-binding protein
MINEAHIDVSGYVATQPFLRVTRTGIPSLSMRVAWTPRRLDRVTGEWVDGDTSFASVTCFRKTAENAATCLRKGDPVVIRGRVSTRNYEDRNGLQRTNIDIDATSIGPDLSRGIATFQRLRPQTEPTALEYQAAAGAESGAGPAGPGDVAADDAALARLMADADSGRGERAGSRAGRDGSDGLAGSDGPEPGDGDFAPDGTSELDQDAAAELGSGGGSALAAEPVGVTVPF